MQIKKFQNYCSQVVKKVDQKYKIKRDNYLAFTQLLEEIGELARDINAPKLRHQKIDRENLAGEFADVFLQLISLAKLYKIDLEQVVKNKIKIIKKRHQI